MKRKLLKASNIILYLATCALVATGLLLELRLDENARSILGLSKDDWGELHFLIALAFAALVLVHLAFHLRWIAELMRNRRPRALVAGVLIAVIIIGGLLVVPAASSPSGEGADPTHRADDD